MRIQGWWGRLLVAMLMLGACSTTASSTTVSVDATPSTTTSAPPSTTSTTVISPESTTTTAPTEVRLPDNDVDDPTEAIVAIFEYVDYLAANPELAHDYLRMVYAESCDCHDRLLVDFETYIENGWVQDDDGIVITEVDVSQTFDNGDVLLEVTYTYSPQYVLEISGERTRLEADEWTNRISLIGLELGDDSRWRVGVIGIVGEDV
jgi:hypothetical protein